MRTFIALAFLVTLGPSLTSQAEESAGALSQCLQAALARKDGSIVKLEVEIAEFSGESYAPPKKTALLEIEIRTADGTEWELTCEEATGKIVEIEREVPGPSHPLFSEKLKVMEDRARQVALGSTPGEITQTEYEIESDGAASYEFNVKPKQAAETGKLRSMQARARSLKADACCIRSARKARARRGERPGRQSAPDAREETIPPAPA